MLCSDDPLSNSFAQAVLSLYVGSGGNTPAWRFVAWLSSACPVYYDQQQVQNKLQKDYEQLLYAGSQLIRLSHWTCLFFLSELQSLDK